MLVQFLKSFWIITVFLQNLIATKQGIQKITGITVFDSQEKITYDSLLELEV